MKNKNGSAVAYALVVIVILGMMLSSLSTFISSRLTAGYRAESKQEALQVAEAGVFFYRWYLAHNTDGRTAQQIDAFWTSGSPLGVNEPYEDDFEDPWGDPIGRYQISIQLPEPGSTIANATVVGWTNKYPLTKRTIKVRFRRPSWSENIVLADDDMRFGEGTTVSGKIHSNRGIRFDGLALGTVSSTLNTYDDPDHTGGNELGVHTHTRTNGTVIENSSVNESNPANIPIRNDIFPAGRRVLMPEIPFNTLVSDLGFMRTEAAIRYDNTGEGRRIILKADGNFDMCKVSSYSVPNENNCGSIVSIWDLSTRTNAITGYFGTISGATGSNAWKNGTSCTTSAACTAGAFTSNGGSSGRCTVNLTTAAIPNKGIIFVANNVWVDGTINNKKVSIVAAELDDEPDYTAVKKNIFIGMNNISYTNHDGRDIIGLIAQNNILAIRDSQNFLEIDAALLAKDGKVGRCYYNGTIRDTITINGSLATKIRYGFAYGSTGYTNRNLNFDDDLLYNPPPYFPTGSQYAVDLWEEL